MTVVDDLWPSRGGCFPLGLFGCWQREGEGEGMMNMSACWAALVRVMCSAWAHPSTSPTPLAKGKHPLLLGKAPGWPRSSSDILTAQHFGVEVEGSGGFPVARALWRGLASGLGLCGASPFLPVSQDCSGGPVAADPLSIQGGMGPAVFSLLPRCCLGLRGSGKSSRSLWGAEPPGKLLLGCGFQADLFILGRKAELDTLKREGLAPGLSQVPEYPPTRGCVLGVRLCSLKFQIYPLPLCVEVHMYAFGCGVAMSVD